MSDMNVSILFVAILLASVAIVGGIAAFIDHRQSTLKRKGK